MTGVAASQPAPAPLLEVDDLVVTYPGRHGSPSHTAIDDVSFVVGDQETVGVVGESGSGKTTLGRAVLGLTAVAGGTISFDGRDISHASGHERRRLSAELQVVFQDPYSSLNPARTIGQTLQESLRVQPGYSHRAARERASLILERVGLGGDALVRYPREFSGGQRQRVAIARALMGDPRLVICDEPVSALDLSVQAQVLNLLRQLQAELKLSLVFISHDLVVVRHVAQRLVVLYRGQVMEQGDAAVIYEHPAHPYTHALISATPIPNPEEQRRRRDRRLRKSVGPTRLMQTGCPYADRCPHAIGVCSSTRPALERTPENTLVACHRWQELRRGPLAVASERQASEVFAPSRGDRDAD